MNTAGYLEINGAQLHVADVRQHTADIHRFREYLPAALELTNQEPRSEGWFAVVESTPDLDALQATCRELGEIQVALSHKLEAARHASLE